MSDNKIKEDSMVQLMNVLTLVEN